MMSRVFSVYLTSRMLIESALDKSQLYSSLVRKHIVANLHTLCLWFCMCVCFVCMKSAMFVLV